MHDYAWRAETRVWKKDLDADGDRKNEARKTRAKRGRGLFVTLICAQPDQAP